MSLPYCCCPCPLLRYVRLSQARHRIFLRHRKQSFRSKAFHPATTAPFPSQDLRQKDFFLPNQHRFFEVQNLFLLKDIRSDHRLSNRLLRRLPFHPSQFRFCNNDFECARKQKQPFRFSKEEHCFCFPAGRILPQSS